MHSPLPPPPVQPEILRVNAHYSDTSDPGLSLVLFALVRSNPPATITWMDQSGQQVANTSDFLILDTQNYPWLSNHSLRVSMNNLTGNVSVNANNSVGAAQSNLTLSGQSVISATGNTKWHLRFQSSHHPHKPHPLSVMLPRLPAVPCGGAGDGHRDGGCPRIRHPPNPHSYSGLSAPQGKGEGRW